MPVWLARLIQGMADRPPMLARQHAFKAVQDSHYVSPALLDTLARWSGGGKPVVREHLPQMYQDWEGNTFTSVGEYLDGDTVEVSTQLAKDLFGVAAHEFGHRRKKKIDEKIFDYNSIFPDYQEADMILAIDKDRKRGKEVYREELLGDQRHAEAFAEAARILRYATPKDEPADLLALVANAEHRAPGAILIARIMLGESEFEGHPLRKTLGVNQIPKGKMSPYLDAFIGRQRDLYSQQRKIDSARSR